MHARFGRGTSSPVDIESGPDSESHERRPHSGPSWLLRWNKNLMTGTGKTGLVSPRLVRGVAVFLVLTLVLGLYGPYWRNSSAADRPNNERWTGRGQVFRDTTKDEGQHKQKQPAKEEEHSKDTNSIQNDEVKKKETEPNYPPLSEPIEDAMKEGGYSPSNLDHMVMVAGHAQLKAFEPSGDSTKDRAMISNVSVWAVKSYQNQDDIHLYLEHIRFGIKLAREDPNALLVFSGGATDKESRWSEGYSYWKAAMVMGDFEAAEDIQDGAGKVPLPYRTIVDASARDSYENLLFSLCRFREFTGKYPKRISVVSYPYKHLRFVHFHRAAMRYPLEGFHFVAPKPIKGSNQHSDAEEFGGPEDFHDDEHAPDLESFSSKDGAAFSISFADSLYKSEEAVIKEVENTRKASATGKEANDTSLDAIPDHELKHSLGSFLTDPHGCYPPLSTKKESRDPFKNGVKLTGCPEMKGLMEVCLPGRKKDILTSHKLGIKNLWVGAVPWEAQRGEKKKN